METYAEDIFIQNMSFLEVGIQVFTRKPAFLLLSYLTFIKLLVDITDTLERHM